MMNKLTLMDKERGSHPNYPPKPQYSNDKPPRKNPGPSSSKTRPQ